MSGENRNGVVTLDFGDDRHRFRLALGELEELQEKTGVGPFALLQRLLGGTWLVQDAVQTLRLGLIGGGMKPAEALKLVRRYVEDRPDWMANAGLAELVLMAALTGSPEEEPGKSDALEATTEAANSPVDASPSEPSTEQPQPQE